MSYSWGAARNPGAADHLRPSRPRNVRPEIVGPADGDPVQMRRLAAELAPMVSEWEELISQHRPNRSGRCRTCVHGATGLPSIPWPCSVYGVAEMARRRYDRSRRGA